jgi:hypothetical protein
MAAHEDLTVDHPVVSHEEWLEARRALLEREKAWPDARVTSERNGRAMGAGARIAALCHISRRNPRSIVLKSPPATVCSTAVRF